MRYVSYTGGNCGNGLGFVPSCIKIPLFRRYPISLMKIVLIDGIDKHYFLQRYPASWGGEVVGIHRRFGMMSRLRSNCSQSAATPYRSPAPKREF